MNLKTRALPEMEQRNGTEVPAWFRFNLGYELNLRALNFSN
jgi:hypothetical protein